MPRITFNFGWLLFAIGIAGYVASGMSSTTALIPSIFGIAFVLLGWIAMQKESMRKHLMHAAAILGLLGIIGTFKGMLRFFAMLGGTEVERPIAVTFQSVMAMLCIVFVVLCVHSFIKARTGK